MDETGCLATYQIDRGSSPWRGFTSSAEEEAAGRTVEALAFPAEGYEPVPGMPAVARSEGKRRVAVDAALFSTLHRADATRSREAPVSIGRCTERALRSMSPREMAGFLIASQIVITYWHVESSLCLFGETDDGTWYTASFRGSHVYFTNKRNEEPLSFRIRIGRKSGEMVLEFP